MTTKQKVRRTARQLYRACLDDSVLDPARVRQVVRRLTASKRRGSLHLLSAFQRLVRLDRDRHTAVVESAAPLESGLRDRLQADLRRVYGTGLDAIFVPTPALIGGVRIKVGSDVFDTSVRGRLAALESRLCRWD
jgi:F-type H+-transporting ATPase subunit delta